MAPILFNKLSNLNLVISPIIGTNNVYTSDISYDNKAFSDYDIIAENFILYKINNSNIELEFLYKSESFYKFLLKLEKDIKNNIIKNSKSIFGKKTDPKKIKLLFKSNIRLNKNKLSMPIIKINISDETLIINKIGTSINKSDLRENTIVLPIFNIHNIIYEQYKIILIIKLKLLQVISDDDDNSSSGSTKSIGSNSSYSSYSKSDYYKRKSGNI